MKIGRIYRVTFEDVTIAAAQDLLSVLGAAGKMCLIRRIVFGATDTTAPTNQQFKLRGRLLPATVTPGSGGSAQTPVKTDPGDASPSFTCRKNDTTGATTSGTAVITNEWGVNIYAGLDEELARPIPIGPSQQFVFEMLSTPSGSPKCSAMIEVEEIGG